MKDIMRSHYEAALFLFHVREINWIFFVALWGWFLPAMAMEIFSGISTVMPYQSIIDVMKPIDWFRAPLIPLVVLISLYSANRMVKNETDTSIVIMQLKTYK